MRLILIDNNSGFIFGDTAEYMAASSEWGDDNTGNERNTERLSLLAARQLDKTIGKRRACWFIERKPRDTSTGYHIYRADVAGSEALPLISDGRDQATIDAVTANCRYLGFVRCEAAR